MRSPSERYFVEQFASPVLSAHRVPQPVVISDRPISASDRQIHLFFISISPYDFVSFGSGEDSVVRCPSLGLFGKQECARALVDECLSKTRMKLCA